MQTVSRSQARKALLNLLKSTGRYADFYNLIDRLRRDKMPSREDRGAALIMTAYLEQMLEDAILCRVTPEFSSSPWRERLFGGDQPGAVDGFRSKIILGYALGLYSEQTREDFQTIRHIRNVFAHSRLSVSFKSKEVADACSFYNVDRIWGGKEDSWLKSASARHRYTTGVFMCVFYLDMTINEEYDGHERFQPLDYTLDRLSDVTPPSPDKPKSPNPRPPQPGGRKKPQP